MSDQSAPTQQSLSRGLIAVLIPPLIIAFVSFVYATLDNRRKDKLDFVRGQIAELYGPLYALSAAHEILWEKLVKQHQPDFENDQNPPGQDKILLWRTALKELIRPLNDQIETTLLSSKQSVRCSYARDALHNFIFYADSVKLLTVTWNLDGDISDKTKNGNIPEMKYPSVLSSLLLNELTALHKREAVLENGLSGLFVWSGESRCEPFPQLQPAS